MGFASLSTGSGTISLVLVNGLEVTGAVCVSGFVSVCEPFPACMRVSVSFSRSVSVFVDLSIPLSISVSVSVSVFVSLCVCVSL